MGNYRNYGPMGNYRNYYGNFPLVRLYKIRNPRKMSRKRTAPAKDDKNKKTKYEESPIDIRVRETLREYEKSKKAEKKEQKRIAKEMRVESKRNGKELLENLEKELLEDSNITIPKESQKSGVMWICLTKAAEKHRTMIKETIDSDWRTGMISGGGYTHLMSLGYTYCAGDSMKPTYHFIDIEKALDLNNSTSTSGLYPDNICLLYDSKCEMDQFAPTIALWNAWNLVDVAGSIYRKLLPLGFHEYARLTPLTHDLTGLKFIVETGLDSICDVNTHLVLKNIIQKSGGSIVERGKFCDFVLTNSSMSREYYSAKGRVSKRVYVGKGKNKQVSFDHDTSTFGKTNFIFYQVFLKEIMKSSSDFNKQLSDNLPSCSDRLLTFQEIADDKRYPWVTPVNSQVYLFKNFKEIMQLTGSLKFTGWDVSSIISKPISARPFDCVFGNPHYYGNSSVSASKMDWIELVDAAVYGDNQSAQNRLLSNFVCFDVDIVFNAFSRILPEEFHWNPEMKKSIQKNVKIHGGHEMLSSKVADRLVSNTDPKKIDMLLKIVQTFDEMTESQYIWLLEISCLLLATHRGESGSRGRYDTVRNIIVWISERLPIRTFIQHFSWIYPLGDVVELFFVEAAPDNELKTSRKEFSPNVLKALATHLLVMTHGYSNIDVIPSVLEDVEKVIKDVLPVRNIDTELHIRDQTQALLTRLDVIEDLVPKKVEKKKSTYMLKKERLIKEKERAEAYHLEEKRRLILEEEEKIIAEKLAAEEKVKMSKMSPNELSYYKYKKGMAEFFKGTDQEKKSPEIQPEEESEEDIKEENELDQRQSLESRTQTMFSWLICVQLMAVRILYKDTEEYRSLASSIWNSAQRLRLLHDPHLSSIFIVLKVIVPLGTDVAWANMGESTIFDKTQVRKTMKLKPPRIVFSLDTEYEPFLERSNYIGNGHVSKQ